MTIHSLMIPSFYPAQYSESGLFFRDQAVALASIGVNSGVAVLEGRSLCELLHKPTLVKNNHFQITHGSEYSLETSRMHGWNPLAQNILGASVYGYLLKKTVDSYIKRYGRPDIIHVQQARWAGLAGSLMLAAYGIPYIVTEHESYFAENKIPNSNTTPLRNIYKKASCIIAVSRAMALSMVGYCDTESIRVIPNCIDTDMFSLPEQPRTINPFRFLCVARLAAIKRIDVLLAAFQQAFGDNRNVKLRIVGDGPEAESLHLFLQPNSVNIEFIGARKHCEICQLMHDSNAFVLTSDVETFGVVLIEALSTGLPLIATRCGGPEDIVNEENGVLVEKGNVAQLAEALTRIRQEYTNYRPDVLRLDAVERFGMVSIGKRIAHVYMDVLEMNGK